MNEKTRDALIDLATAVEKLTGSCLRDVGMDEAQKIVQVCEDLKDALRKDETIP